MNRTLLTQALIKFLAGILLIGLLVFLPAGSFAYWQGWLLMYMSTVIMFLSMPLVLGSPISFIIMLGYIPVIAKRIRNEEDVLTTGLDGYKEYKTRVKYKVIPFIW